MKAKRKKFCPSCEKDLPIDCFGFSKAQPDGRNRYCKVCALEKVHAYRVKKRAEKLAAKLAAKRDRVEIEALQRTETITLVRNAVGAGCATRDAIHEQTQLPWDDLVDALAELTFERGVLRIERVGKQRKFRLAA